jgi:hypothetical protein
VIFIDQCNNKTIVIPLVHPHLNNSVISTESIILSDRNPYCKDYQNIIGIYIGTGLNGHVTQLGLIIVQDNHLYIESIGQYSRTQTTHVSLQMVKSTKEGNIAAGDIIGFYPLEQSMV